jgi:CelD/BcsL family acetyltransferase involved in cellulose biosynthesis
MAVSAAQLLSSEETVRGGSRDGTVVTVIRSLPELERLAGQWKELLAGSQVNRLFLTWEWIYAWARCFVVKNRSLFVLSVIHRGKLIGLAPWYIEERRWGPWALREIRLLGTPDMGSDYLEMIARKGAEHRTVTALYDALKGPLSGAWECLRLEEVPAGSLTLQHLLARLDEEGRYYSCELKSFCPRVRLPATWEAYLGSLSRNRRERFRRDARRLEADADASVQLIGSEAPGFAGGLDAFLALHREQWGPSSDRVRRFLEVFRDRWFGNDSAELLVVNENENTVTAGMLLLRYQDTTSMLLLSVDRKFRKGMSIGNLLVGLSIKSAIEQGYRCYDFLKGAEAYKLHWANDCERSVCVRIYQRRSAVLATAALELLQKWLKLALRG